MVKLTRRAALITGLLLLTSPNLASAAESASGSPAPAARAASAAPAAPAAGAVRPLAAGGRLGISGWGTCLDVKDFNPNDGAPVQMWGCDTNSNQFWTAYPDGTIHDGLNNKCLDVREFNPNNGAQVQVWSCSGASNQLWYVNKLTGPFEIRSVMNNKCLDVRDFNSNNGATVQMWDCSGGPNQHWTWK
jgi:hypothetical protein